MAKRIQKLGDPNRGRGRKSKPKKRKSNHFRLVAFLFSWLAVFLLFIIFKILILGLLINKIGHRPTEGDYAGNLIHESISDYLAIVENKNNKERLLSKLSDPVVWFNKKYKHANLPTYSDYDQFEYIGPLQYDSRDPQNNNFEIRFDGAYRYRNPGKYLLNFESGTVIIERGVISSLMTRKKPNAYTSQWVNTVYRYYLPLSLLAGFVITLILLNISKIPEKIVERLFNLMQKLIGG